MNVRIIPDFLRVVKSRDPITTSFLAIVKTHLKKYCIFNFDMVLFNQEMRDISEMKGHKAMTQQQAVKSSFEWQQRTFKTYWNGKTYGDTRYIDVTSDRGQIAKVTCSTSKGVSVNKAHSIEFARAAMASVGIEA